MTKQTTPTQKMLVAWGWILIIWSIYRFVFKTGLGIYIDEFIAKPLVFIVPVFIYIKHYEKKDFLKGVGINLRNLSQDLFLGGLVAIAFTLILIFSSGFQTLVSNFNRLLNQESIFMILALALITSISEEVLSRGFVLKRLYEESKNIFTSSFFASLLYFFIRVPILFSNDNIVGTTLLSIMLSDIVFSLAVSFVFLTRRSLVLPIIIHLLYILNIYLYLGFS